MFRITPCDQLQTGRIVVKGCEYDATLEAERIVADARAIADSIRKEGEREYERQKKQGYDDGWNQAQAIASERMLATITEANAYFSAVENRVVEVVRKALRKVVGKWDDDDLLIQVVRQALSWARNQSRVTLRVCPAQAPQLQSQAEEIRISYPMIDVLDVVADDRLGPLDCILETDIGTVDANIYVQLAAIEAAMKKAVGNESSTLVTHPDLADDDKMPWPNDSVSSDP